MSLLWAFIGLADNAWDFCAGLNEGLLAVFLSDALLLVGGLLYPFATRGALRFLRFWAVTKLLCVSVGVLLYVFGIFVEEKGYVFGVVAVVAYCVLRLVKRVQAVLNLFEPSLKV